MVMLELQGFLERWNDDVIHPFLPRPPNDQDVQAIDWSGLDAWAAGNAISVDQSTIVAVRRIIDLMFQKKRDQLFMEELNNRNPSPDVGRMQQWPHSPLNGTGTGHESYSEDFSNDPDCRTCIHYRGISSSPVEYGLCRAFQELATGDAHGLRGTCDSHREKLTWKPKRYDLSGGIGYTDIQSRFQSHLDRRGNILPNWRKVARALLWMIENQKAELIDGKEARVIPTDHENLLVHLASDRAARVRLTQEWDVYIYARWGGEVHGEWRLQRAPPSQNALRYDLHIVLAETLGRAYQWNQANSEFREWGLEQYKARERLCNHALNRPGRYVTCYEYYHEYAVAGAGHMADSYQARQLQDVNAAWFRFKPTPLPEGGRYSVDPRLIRWREWNRDRARGHV